MRRVSLSLFGGFQARLERGPALTFRTRKAQALLAYLVLHRGRVHRRENLAAVFWGEMPDEQARGSLRHALYELRRALAAAPAVLRIEGDTVAVNASIIDLDVATFTRLLADGTTSGARAGNRAVPRRPLDGIDRQGGAVGACG